MGLLHPHIVIQAEEIALSIVSEIKAVLSQRSGAQLLASLTKDEGARRIIASHPEKVATVEFPQGAIDIDTPDDYERLVNPVHLEIL